MEEGGLGLLSPHARCSGPIERQELAFCRTYRTRVISVLSKHPAPLGSQLSRVVQRAHRLRSNQLIRQDSATVGQDKT